MSTTVIAVLLAGSLAAGWIDAVVGGGGLILLPLIMIMAPGLTNAQALGTNKFAAVFGTTSAAITLARRIPTAMGALRWAPLALIGAAIGALIAASVDQHIMRPIIIVVLVAVGFFVLLRPSFGRDTEPRIMSKRSWTAGAAVILAIGIYDGAFGPGTGLFFIMSLTALMRGDFMTSAAWAKILNVATNIGALIVFGLRGDVLWLLGLGLAVTNIIGARIGARMVLGRGAGFVRVVILCVVVIMSGKLAYDQFFA